jgi:hypothetical protein
MNGYLTQATRMRRSKELLLLTKFMILLIILCIVIWIVRSDNIMMHYETYTVNFTKHNLNCSTMDLQLLDNLTNPLHIAADSRCPKTTWLKEMYEVEAIQNKGRGNTDLLGISIGCNTGVDAIGTSRMMSQNPFFSKQQWLYAMENATQTSLMAVCRSIESQQKGDHADLDDIAIDTNMSMKQIEFHCIEPMASTFQALNISNLKLGLNQHSFHVHQCVMSDTPGSAYFPIGGAGVENMGAFMCPTETSSPTSAPTMAANTTDNGTTTMLFILLIYITRKNG